VTSAVLGESGVQYDIDKLHWLGSTDSAFHYAFFTRTEVGLNTIEKLQAYSGLRIGATSIGHTTSILTAGLLPGYSVSKTPDSSWVTPR